MYMSINDLPKEVAYKEVKKDGRIYRKGTAQECSNCCNSKRRY